MEPKAVRSLTDAKQGHALGRGIANVREFFCTVVLTEGTADHLQACYAALHAIVLGMKYHEII